MRFLCLLVGEPDVETPVPGSPDFLQMLADYESATAAMAAGGVLVDSGPLQPPAAASTLRVRRGRTLVTDGPLIETKEVIGGYYVLDCADVAEVVHWMKAVPAAAYGAIDVRPVMAMPDVG